MNQSGYYFVNFMLHMCYDIIEAFGNVWAFFTQPLILDFGKFTVDLRDYGIDWTLLELMFTFGIGTYLVFILIKFVLDIVF